MSDKSSDDVEVKLPTYCWLLISSIIHNTSDRWSTSPQTAFGYEGKRESACTNLPRILTKASHGRRTAQSNKRLAQLMEQRIDTSNAVRYQRSSMTTEDTSAMKFGDNADRTARYVTIHDRQPALMAGGRSMPLKFFLSAVLSCAPPRANGDGESGEVSCCDVAV